MTVLSKRHCRDAAIIGLVAVFLIVMGILLSIRKLGAIGSFRTSREMWNLLVERYPADIRSFVDIRYEWDRTPIGQAEDQFANRCLAPAREFPNTRGELSALYMAACRAPGTEAGRKASELFIARIAGADLGDLATAIQCCHVPPAINALTESRPNPQSVRYYYSYREQEDIAAALLARLKRRTKDPRAAALLLRVCDMSKGSDGLPTALFVQAADLIASDYAGSPDIYNFCETLGNVSGSPRFAAQYEPHLRAILNVNQHRFVRCTAQFALASLLEWSGGGSRQGEAEDLYRQFLESFDGHHQYPYQKIEQMYRDQARKSFEGLRRCGIGKMAPEIVGVDTDGWPMRLSEYRGKVVLLSFWATWCGPCMRLIPHERELAERLDGKLFAIVGVNGDTDEKAPMAAVAAHNITWRSFRNIRTNQPAIEEEWRVQGWPELYLIDQEGVVRERWLDWDEQTLDEINKAIDHVLGPAP